MSEIEQIRNENQDLNRKIKSIIECHEQERAKYLEELDIMREQRDSAYKQAENAYRRLDEEMGRRHISDLTRSDEMQPDFAQKGDLTICELEWRQKQEIAMKTDV
jgi:hypothetical protein